MNKLISILLLCVFCSCHKGDSHAYSISYNPSPTLTVTGSTELARASHNFVFCNVLTADDEVCLIKKDSVGVSKIWPNAANFKIEYLGTDTDFSNPVNFNCQ